MRRSNHPCCTITLVFAAARCLGCGGPAPPTVTGEITLDGKPLAGATVTFMPHDRTAAGWYGRTDHQGNYELQADVGSSETAVGAYVVRITTYGGPGGAGSPPVPERVPVRYNLRSELTATVAAGANVHNFTLQTKGNPIIQPVEAIE